ncbi:hypothetical protein EDD21DRAFT_364910 [Dissophora ornata]|nr:hypothetical protein EDD21DRAFT_364910 [Dissophora ornata]
MSSDQSLLHGADPASNSQQQSGDSNTAPVTPSSTGSNTATNSASSQLQPAAEQPKKAKRKRITPEQLEDLVGLFEKTDTPSFEIREGLAKKLGMTNREIQVMMTSIDPVPSSRTPHSGPSSDEWVTRQPY